MIQPSNNMSNPITTKNHGFLSPTPPATKPQPRIPAALKNRVLNFCSDYEKMAADGKWKIRLLSEDTICGVLCKVGDTVILPMCLAVQAALDGHGEFVSDTPEK